MYFIYMGVNQFKTLEINFGFLTYSIQKNIRFEFLGIDFLQTNVDENEY